MTSTLVSGIAQQLAEIYYIVGAQQLEGYGQVPIISIIYFHSALQTTPSIYIAVFCGFEIGFLQKEPTTTQRARLILS